MNLKNYNIFSAINEFKVIITLVFITGGIVYRITDKRDYILIYAVIVQVLFIVLLVYSDVNNFLKVRNYIKQNEQEINNKYQINTGFGYINFFRNFSENDINRLLSSPVKKEFSKCYIFPIKVMMSFIITVCIFILVSLLHSN